MIDPTPWSGRSHPGPRTMPLRLPREQRRQFEAALGPATAQKRVVLRAQAVLLMAAAVAPADIAKILGVHLRTVEKWKVRFSCESPIERLADAHRSGRPPSLFRRRTASRSSRPHVVAPVA